MKRIANRITMLLLCLFVVAGTSAFAQNEQKKEAKPKGAVKKEVKKTKPDSTNVNDVDKAAKHPQEIEKHDVEEKEADKYKTEEGKAYGKEKGDVEGKEFGQSRAEQARMSHENKTRELDESVTEGADKVKDSRGKIDEARTNLEKDKKAKKISDAEYKEKKEKIDKAEEAINDLEKKVEKGKEIKSPPAEPLK